MNLPSPFSIMLWISRACLQPCANWIRLARLAQVEAGLTQLMQLTVFASMYQMSSAQAGLVFVQRSVATLYCDLVALPLHRTRSSL